MKYFSRLPQALDFTCMAMNENILLVRHGFFDELKAGLKFLAQIGRVQVAGLNIFSDATIIRWTCWFVIQNGQDVGDVQCVECLVVLRRIDVTEPDVIVDLICAEGFFEANVGWTEISERERSKLFEQVMTTYLVMVRDENENFLSEFGANWNQWEIEWK